MLKTSEFWMTVISALVGAAVSLHLVSPSVAEMVMKFVGMGLTYVFGRLVSKAAKGVFASSSDGIKGIGRMALVLGLGLALSTGTAHALSLRYMPSLSVWGGYRDGSALVKERQLYRAARLGWNVSKRIGVQATTKRGAGKRGNEYDIAVGLKLF